MYLLAPPDEQVGPVLFGWAGMSILRGGHRGRRRRAGAIEGVHIPPWPWPGEEESCSENAYRRVRLTRQQWCVRRTLLWFSWFWVFLWNMNGSFPRPHRNGGKPPDETALLRRELDNAPLYPHVTSIMA